MTQENTVKQKREHAEIYRDIVTSEQSKYIALHVGLFWSVGTFLIKNQDIVKIMLDSKKMYEHLAHDTIIQDRFIKKRIEFIRLLIKQRQIDVIYELIEDEQNIATIALKDSL